MQYFNSKCCQDDLCCQIPWLPCKICLPTWHHSWCNVILSYKGCLQHPLCAYSHSPDLLPSTAPQKVSLELLLCICVQPVMPLLTVLLWTFEVLVSSNLYRVGLRIKIGLLVSSTTIILANSPWTFQDRPGSWRCVLPFWKHWLSQRIIHVACAYTNFKSDGDRLSEWVRMSASGSEVSEPLPKDWKCKWQLHIIPTTVVRITTCHSWKMGLECWKWRP